MFFQQYCLLCHRRADDRLCAPCLRAIDALAIGPHRCLQCALPLSEGADYCGRCLRREPAFYRALIPYRYQFPLDYLIARYKFHGCTTSARALTGLFAHWLSRAPQHPQPDLILPAPMHWRRRLGRGFNQAQVLAAAAARATHTPWDGQRLIKHRHTPSQRGLARRQRQDNIRGSIGASGVDGLAVALVDDVVTTATTAREISRCLIRAGARSVELWALARTPDEFD